MSVVNRLLNSDFIDVGYSSTLDDYVPTNWDITVEGLPNTNRVIAGYSTINAYEKDHAAKLIKSVSGGCGLSQTTDFGYDLNGENIKVGAWVKVSTCDVGGAIEVYAFWYDDGGSQVGSEQTVATISSTGNYTLYSDELTAPSGAYQIKLGVKATGGNLDVVAYVGLTYIFGEKDYGLLVKDVSGNNSFLIPDVAFIVASGTTSLSDSLNADGTYGTEIDLPVLEAIDSKYIGVLCQIRDFDWESKINILGYDYSGGSPQKWWGSFFGDSAVTYYEKDADTGIMTSFVPGNMTGGDQSTWDPLLSIGLLSGWDKNLVETSKIRLYAFPYYAFLHTFSGTPTTGTLYGRYEQIIVNDKSGYSVSSVQGTALQNGEVECPYTDYGGWWLNVFWKGPKSKFDIYVVHNDGSEDLLASDVAYDDAGWNIIDTIKEESRSATWDCPETDLETTDALKFVLKVSGEFLSGMLTGSWSFSYSITFITGKLGWTKLSESTWTLYRYFWAEVQRGQKGKFRTYWGDGSKEMKITNVGYTPLSGTTKNVVSIGSEGVSEIDYVVFLKNYAGLS